MVLVLGMLASIAARAAGCKPEEVWMVIDHKARIKYLRHDHNGQTTTSQTDLEPSLCSTNLVRCQGGKQKFETVDWRNYRSRDIWMFAILYDSTVYVKVDITPKGYIVHFYFGDTARLLTNRARQEEIELIEQKRGQYVQLPANLQRRLPERKRLTSR